MNTADVNRCVQETDEFKVCDMPEYHFVFSKKNGSFARWGRTKDDDAVMAPAPEIADIEVCVNGCPNKCAFCYKGNTDEPPTNMSLETFKGIIDKMPLTLTQVAFGITGVQTNPDFLAMMKYCREKGIIPNFTCTGIDMTEELADEFAKVIGAVAVSAYQTDKEVCYDTVKMFTDRGIAQTNIHLMVCKETLLFAYEVLRDTWTDPRLEKLNAVVFLGLKPKGRAKDHFHPLSYPEFKGLVDFCIDNDIDRFGFDSCTAPKFEKAITESSLEEETKKLYIQMSEPCESSLFSTYINVIGECWNCSFAEGEESVQPISVIGCEDYVRDIWHSPPVEAFRKRLLDNKRLCPIWKEINVGL